MRLLRLILAPMGGEGEDSPHAKARHNVSRLYETLYQLEIAMSRKICMSARIIGLLLFASLALFVPGCPGKPLWPEQLRNSIGMVFVRIEAGKFMMGSQNGFDDEQPVHRVQISQPFYLGKYEVTQGQWEQVMEDNLSGFTGNSNRPVEEVSWHDVQAFIERLNAREGREIYRLPTEAEWEYAARAGTTTDYHFGNDRSQLGKYAWYSKTSGYETHPVGQLQPNAWGLHDMHGNVWEWVQDGYDASYYERSPARDPRGPSRGSSRVNRGGGWDNRPASVRSAFRYWDHPARRRANLGVRLLRTSP
ncbi:Hercynine oxygenase [Candidatus Entotheonellaceae bacterium PAL068K]